MYLLCTILFLFQVMKLSEQLLQRHRSNSWSLPIGKNSILFLYSSCVIKTMFYIFSCSKDLVNIVKERMQDKNFQVRKEALTGLAIVYQTSLNDQDIPEATKKGLSWIKDTILHHYYMTGLEDRFLVQRLLNKYLVPYQLPAAVRMQKLYLLYATVDERAKKAVIEILISQASVCKAVSDLTEVYELQFTEVDRDKEITSKVVHLSKYLPDSTEAAKFIRKLADNLAKYNHMLRLLKMVVDPERSCKERTDAASLLLKKLGHPVRSNTYYFIVKDLIERSLGPIDQEAVRKLV